MASENAIEEFVEAKERANFRPSYVRSLRQYLNLFARGRESMLVSEFKPKHIDAWFDSRKESPSTRASNLGRLTSFFSWAVRKRYTLENPCTSIEHIRIDRKTPQILSVDQLEILLKKLRDRRPAFLLWFVLAAFVGIRREELARMNLEAIKTHLPQRLIIIDAAASKVRRRRVISLSLQECRWIKFALSIGGMLPISEITVRRRIRGMRKRLGWSRWPQDILRHTALSFHLARTKNASAVALNAGNSQKILLTHYNGLVTPNELKKFLKLRPV